jgi:hypothetical protein
MWVDGSTASPKIALDIGPPRRTPERSDHARPIYSHPLFWLGAAAVAAGGTTAAIYAATRGGSSGPSQVTLTPALQCGPSSPCR